jgi:hypothetical protein
LNEVDEVLPPEFALNLKAANPLGLKIPDRIRAIADMVIE